MGCGREGVIGVVWCVMKGLVCVCVVCVHTSRGCSGRVNFAEGRQQAGAVGMGRARGCVEEYPLNT